MPTSQIEVRGEIIIALVEGLGAFEEITRRILTRNGIENPERGTWYPYSSFIQSLTMIVERSGPLTMQRVGIRMAYMALWPSMQAISIERILNLLDEVIYLNFRGGDVGHLTAERFMENSAYVRSTLGIPPALEQGFLQGALERFCAPGLQVSIALDETSSAGEMKDSFCLYAIQWSKPV